MKIAIDVRPLMSGKISGVEMYIDSMLKELFKRDTKNDHFVLWYSGHKEVDFSKYTKHYSNVTVKHTRIPNKLLNLFFSLLRWPKVDKLIGEGIDLIWVPDPRPTPVSKGFKKIMTFHDLSFEDFSHSFNKRTRLWHKILRPRKEAEEAHHIIAVSKFTCQQLIEEYGVHEKRVSYIYEAASEHLQPIAISKLFDVIAKEYRLPKEYFLCLSTLEARKNIKGTIKAFLRWKKDVQSEVKLVIAGQEYPKIFKGMNLEDHPDIIMTGFVREEDKALLYQHALAFVYPSLYEGFGLPILEAMQCGAPVITSDATATKEVAGEAAYLVNPNDLDQIKEAMHDMYRDETLRADLIEKGFARAKEFSWKNAVKELMRVFQA